MTKQKEPSKTPNYDKLSAKEKLFVNAYIRNGCNQVKAYLEVYPKASKTKYTSARTEAWKIMTNPDIRTAADEKLQEYIDNKEGVTRDLIRNLQKMTNVDIGDYIKVKDGIVQVVDLENTDTYPIKSITQSEGNTTTTKITLEERTKAMDLLSKITRIIEDKPPLDLNGANVNIYMPDNKRIKKEGEE